MSGSSRPKRGLGRGLDALLSPAKPPPDKPAYREGSVFLCPVEKIRPQKGQPRQHFDEEALEELAASIREHGLIEPLVVRRTTQGDRDSFELIAGERRWRAAQRAGHHEVLVVVKDVSPQDAFELALVENIQRADLDAIEVAEAYDRLVQEHGYTTDALAAKLGRDRSTIANSLRLLKLPHTIRSKVIHRELSEGHARALLGAPDEKTMHDLAERTLRARLSVRALESLIRRAKQKKTKKEPDPKTEARSAAIRDLEARLRRRLGTKADVEHTEPGGRIVIHYGSLDELDRLLELLGA